MFRQFEFWKVDFYTLWKLRNFTATIFFAKIPSNQLFTKKVYAKLLWREKLRGRYFLFFHTVLCVIVVWTFEIKNFSWNHYQLIKCVLNWRNFSMFKFNYRSCFRFDGKSVSNISTRFKVFYYLIQKLLKCGVIAEKYAKGYKRIHQSLLAEWQLKCCM